MSIKPDTTALVIPVPAADPVVGEWRARLDPTTALGVPPHITVLYPFLSPAALTEADLAALRQLFRSFDPFSFALPSVGRSVRYVSNGLLWMIIRNRKNIWTIEMTATAYGMSSR